MKVKISLVLLTAFSSNALAENSIIGGTVVNSQDWISRTVVALVSKSAAGEALCTVSLVAPDLGITAAHCVTSEDGSPIQALALIFSGNLKSATPDLVRSIDQAMVPADWSPRGTKDKDTGDVAVVHFAGGLPSGYQYSDLLPFDQVLTVGEKVELAGYGISNALGDSGAGVLRKTNVVVSNPAYSPTEVEFDQTHGGGACHGDSGGPAYLMINNHPYLFGITSRGSGNCDQDVVYSQISKYSDWFKIASDKVRGK